MDFLSLTVILVVIVIAILLGVLAYITLKEKHKEKSSNTAKKADDEIEATKAKRSIFKFMEFDTIEDNMIVQDGGKRYLMVIECKGVNYDLLSSLEKNGVEQGFIAFLNALKFEVQLYIQTRKVNLAQSTMKYRERLKAIEMDMLEEEQKYQNMLRDSTATREEILKELKEVTKKKNLYEYGKDVIENTEQMSADSDLTTKEYYIVVPYYTEEITSAGDYDKREIGSMAFSELYTRAQSLVGALTECDVRGRILSSKELVELLFISYNREQHDTYDFEEYIGNSGFDSFYSVSPDVLEKRIEALDEEIAKKAKDKALEAYRRVNRKTELKMRAVREREERMKEYINSLAEEALESQASVIGIRTVEESKQELKQMDIEAEERSKKAEQKVEDDEEDMLIENSDEQDSKDNKLEDEEINSKGNNLEDKEEIKSKNNSLENQKGKNSKDNSSEDTKEINAKDNILEDEKERARKAKMKKISELSHEEKVKLAKKLKKKKMLKEMEAKKNGQN